MKFPHIKLGFGITGNPGSFAPIDNILANSKDTSVGRSAINRDYLVDFLIQTYENASDKGVLSLDTDFYSLPDGVAATDLKWMLELPENASLKSLSATVSKKRKEIFPQIFLRTAVDGTYTVASDTVLELWIDDGNGIPSRYTSTNGNPRNFTTTILPALTTGARTIAQLIEELNTKFADAGIDDDVVAIRFSNVETHDTVGLLFTSHSEGKRFGIYQTESFDTGYGSRNPAWFRPGSGGYNLSDIDVLNYRTRRNTGPPRNTPFIGGVFLSAGYSENSIYHVDSEWSFRDYDETYFGQFPIDETHWKKITIDTAPFEVWEYIGGTAQYDMGEYGINPYNFQVDRVLPNGTALMMDDINVTAVYRDRFYG